jgi:hypothetical protein
LLWFSAVVQGEFDQCSNIPGPSDCSVPHSLFGAFINLLLLIQWIHCHYETKIIGWFRMSCGRYKQHGTSWASSSRFMWTIRFRKINTT